MKTRNRDFQRVHVFNLTVLDNHQDADTGARHTLIFVEMVIFFFFFLFFFLF